MANMVCHCTGLPKDPNNGQERQAEALDGRDSEMCFWLPADVQAVLLHPRRLREGSCRIARRALASPHVEVVGKSSRFGHVPRPNLGLEPSRPATRRLGWHYVMLYAPTFSCEGLTFEAARSI
jgi:hypothetical protein